MSVRDRNTAAPEQNWSSEKSYKLESLLAESGIPVALGIWSG